jgi:hypothetical protein
MHILANISIFSYIFNKKVMDNDENADINTCF